MSHAQPEARLVWVRSKPILLIPPTDAKPHSRVLGDLYVSESVELLDGSGHRKGAVLYSILIETKVCTLDDLHKRSSEAYDLAEDLKRVWTYICGEPIGVAYLQLVPVSVPDSWTTNVAEVQRQIENQVNRLRGEIHFESRRYTYCTKLPLAAALDICEAYRNASEILRALIELHYLALTSERSEARLFFLAKGLEIARELIPGPSRDHAQKQRALPKEIQDDLHKSLHWLFETANGKVEVRHAVKPGQNPPELHPHISPEEQRWFEHDADSVIRAIVCMQLGRDPFVIKAA